MDLANEEDFHIVLDSIDFCIVYSRCGIEFLFWCGHLNPDRFLYEVLAWILNLLVGIDHRMVLGLNTWFPCPLKSVCLDRASEPLASIPSTESNLTYRQRQWALKVFTTTKRRILCTNSSRNLWERDRTDSESSVPLAPMGSAHNILNNLPTLNSDPWQTAKSRRLRALLLIKAWKLTRIERIFQSACVRTNIVAGLLCDWIVRDGICAYREYQLLP